METRKTPPLGENALVAIKNGDGNDSSSIRCGSGPEPGDGGPARGDRPGPDDRSAPDADLSVDHVRAGGCRVHKGYTYSRQSNPTVAALERRLAALEGASHCTAFGTGLGATTAVRLFQQVLSKFGVDSVFVNAADPRALEEALREPTQLLFLETPANPTLKLTDIVLASRLGRAAGAVVVVDNTLLTPVQQRPLDLGADVALHSTTKFIEGHNATVGGALLTRSGELHEKLFFLRNCIGAIQSPFNAWLTLQGTKTLPLRMKQHSENAMHVARFLEKHPRVTRILYPGLESFPQYDLARRQQVSGGALLAFEVEGGADAGIAVMNSVKLCSLAGRPGSSRS